MQQLSILYICEVTDGEDYDTVGNLRRVNGPFQGYRHGSFANTQFDFFRDKKRWFVDMNAINPIIAPRLKVFPETLFIILTLSNMLIHMLETRNAEGVREFVHVGSLQKVVTRSSRLCIKCFVKSQSSLSQPVAFLPSSSFFEKRAVWVEAREIFYRFNF